MLPHKINFLYIFVQLKHMYVLSFSSTIFKFNIIIIEKLIFAKYIFLNTVLLHYFQFLITINYFLVSRSITISVSDVRYLSLFHLSLCIFPLFLLIYLLFRSIDILYLLIIKCIPLIARLFLFII